MAHQGKELRQIAERHESITLFAKELGIVRDTLYKLFKRQTIPAKYVEKLRTMGINFTQPDGTKPDGTGTYRMNFRRQYPYTKASGELSMNDLILLSIEQLFSLQNEQEDLQMVKAIQQVIAYKQYAEGLERENKLLKEMIELLKK